MSPSTTTEVIASLPCLQDEFHVGAELGRGGFGVVHRGRNLETKAPVAIKLPRFDAEMVEPARILREARLLTDLNHPNLVAFLGLYRTVSGQLALVYELVLGSGLDVLVAGGPLDPSRALPILDGVAAGLDHLHQAGMVHRDLKSENILIGRHLTPKLLDFGLTRPVSPGATLTATGVIAGTPEFTAPEIFLGEPASPRSDLYALGCVAFEALCGRPPIEGSIIEVMHAHQRGELPRVPRELDHLPATLDQAFAELLARDPEARPASAAAVVARLRAALEDPAPARAPIEPGASQASQELDTPGRPRPRTRGRPWAIGAGLAAGALALVAWTLPGALGPPAAPSPAPTRDVPAGLPPDLPARHRDQLEALGDLRVQGATLLSAAEAPSDAPLALGEPLVWGPLLDRVEVAGAWRAWLDEGGDRTSLPQGWLETLRQQEEAFMTRRLPPGPPPLFPHLDLAPSPDPVPLQELLDGWPRARYRRSLADLPDPAGAWIGAAYGAMAAAFRERDRAEEDWRLMTQGGASRLGFPQHLGLHLSVKFGVADYEHYLEAAWDSRGREVRAQLARALLPAARAAHRGVVAVARAAADAEGRQRAALVRLAHHAWKRLSPVIGASYLCTLQPEDLIPRFPGAGWGLLAARQAREVTRERQRDPDWRPASDYLVHALAELAVTPTTPELDARVRGEFLVEATRPEVRAQADLRERILPVFRGGALEHWAADAVTGLGRLATYWHEEPAALPWTRGDLERLRDALAAAAARSPGADGLPRGRVYAALLEHLGDL